MAGAFSAADAREVEATEVLPQRAPGEQHQLAVEKHDGKRPDGPFHRGAVLSLRRIDRADRAGPLNTVPKRARRLRDPSCRVAVEFGD